MLSLVLQFAAESARKSREEEQSRDEIARAVAHAARFGLEEGLAATVEYARIFCKESRPMERSAAGLVVLHPLVNYIDALPIKIVEYMAAGIPVICFGNPLWRVIVESTDCGLCVNPLDPLEIAGAIQ